MEAGKVNKLVVMLSHGANDDKATVGFTIANAALSSGMQVAVFLTSDGVELSRDGSCDLTHVQPFKKLAELIDTFVHDGGVLWSCAPCFRHRGMKQEETVEQTLVTGAGSLLEWVRDGAATLSIRRRPMALTCPASLDPQQLREEVRALYGRVAEDPSADFHFHRGPGYAVDFLGYDAAELDALPARACASFAGVGNPHQVDKLLPGETAVDIGCGAGMDLLLAAGHVGPTGRAIDVDMTASMIAAARASAREAGLENVEIRAGEAEELPIDDASVDVVLSNGVLNLTPDKRKAFAEIARVLRPGGRLLLADIVVAHELSDKIRSDIDLWTS